MIKPKYEIVEFDTGDILLSSGYYVENTYINGETLKNLEKMFNNGLTSFDAFVDCINFDTTNQSSISNEDDEYYKIDCIEYVGQKYNENYSRYIPHYKITLINKNISKNISEDNAFESESSIVDWLLENVPQK